MGEFIELHELLPSRLTTPELTFSDLFSLKEKHKPKKEITSIQEWVVCFNTYISLVEMRQPHRVGDLLAYSSIIVKSSREYEDTPWQKSCNQTRKGLG